MDFYCLTDTMERVDHEQMSTQASDQVMKSMIEAFVNKGPYRTMETADGGFVIQNQNTHVNQIDGHVYQTGTRDQFNNPDERVNAATQDFTDESQIQEDTGA